jgi:hypothetical protein
MDVCLLLVGAEPWPTINRHSEAGMGQNPTALAGLTTRKRRYVVAARRMSAADGASCSDACGADSGNRFRIALRASGMTIGGALGLSRRASTQLVIPGPLTRRVSGTWNRFRADPRTLQPIPDRAARVRNDDKGRAFGCSWRPE